MQQIALFFYIKNIKDELWMEKLKKTNKAQITNKKSLCN